MGDMVITASQKVGDRWEHADVPTDITSFLFRHDGTETVVSVVENGKKEYYCGDFGTRGKYVGKGIAAGMFYDLMVRLEGE